MKILFKLLNYLKELFKNTRGVRIIKCKVELNGKKTVVFQALGSFHSEEIDYDDYKVGLIYDTEPSDVELAAIFFHSFNFDKYKIYSFDPINKKISICNSLQKNVVEINSDNWLDSVQYFKKMETEQLKHLLNTIVNFEINKLIDCKFTENYAEAYNSQNESESVKNVINLCYFKNKKELNHENTSNN